MEQKQQVVTLSINCDKACPTEKPVCCIDCKNFKLVKDRVEVVEILDDTRIFAEDTIECTETSEDNIMPN